MAACRGKATKNEDALDEDAQGATPQQNLPESNLALARAHAILDHMSSSECVKRKESNKDNNSDNDYDDDGVLAQSSAVNDAM
eukprot:12419788-Karenia_brevis.AAC.1